MLTKYPEKNLKNRVPADIWEDALKCWTSASSIMVKIIEKNGGNNENELQEKDFILFLYSYLVNSDIEVNGLMESQLRKNIFKISTYIYKFTSVSSTSPFLVSDTSALWSYIRIYISNNVSTVHQVLERLKKAQPMVVKKIGEYLLFMIKNDLCDLLDVEIFKYLASQDFLLLFLLDKKDNRNPIDIMQTLSKLYPSHKGTLELAYCFSLNMLTTIPQTLSLILQSMMSAIKRNSSPKTNLMAALLVASGLLDKIESYPDNDHFSSQVLSGLKTIQMKLPKVELSELPLMVVANRNEYEIKNNKDAPELSNSLEDFSKINDSDCAQISSLFPEMDPNKIKQILISHNNSVERSIEYILEEGVNDKDEKDENFIEPNIAPIGNNSNSTNNIKEKKNSSRYADNLIAPSTSTIINSNNESKMVDTSSRISSKAKERILSALEAIYKEDEIDEAYDEDYYNPDDAIVDATISDDEKDTYPSAEDIETQEGNSDNDKSDRRALDLDIYLFKIYNQNPSLFGLEGRKTAERAKLTEELKWSHEQLEGWVKMLQRDVRKRKSLENVILLQSGTLNRSDNQSNSQNDSQNSLEKTGGNKSNIQRGGRKSGDNGKKGKPDNNRKGKPDKGGDEGSSNNINSSAKNRAYKEHHKSSRANHNRKAGHAKKMDKGFF